MDLIARNLPIDVLQIIFNYTPDYIFRGNKLIQIKKITKDKYIPLNRLFHNNRNCMVTHSGFLNSFKQVSLLTEDGRYFYTLQYFCKNFYAYINNKDENQSIIVYKRK